MTDHATLDDMQNNDFGSQMINLEKGEELPTLDDKIALNDEEKLANCEYKDKIINCQYEEKSEENDDIILLKNELFIGLKLSIILDLISLKVTLK